MIPRGASTTRRSWSIDPGMAEIARSPLCDTHREEIASAVTHGAGLVFSLAALVGMMGASGGEALRLTAAAVFGGSLVLLYLSSTLYHLFTEHRRKAFFQMLDHACIYLLIAGSYTPLTLVALKGPWGWSLFGVVWFLALAGILVKTLVARRRDHWISTALYIGMGWLAVIALGPMIRALPLAGFLWIVAGGVSYTAGVVFFVWNRLPFNHAIWHLFVLGGSVCHVIAVYCYILR
jgi:hemolysin III